MTAKSLSLVLGSGGARGLAHIGVIEVLEERGYRVKSLAGSSMGALIGGIYAMGKLEAYRDWACALDRSDVLKLLDFSFGTTGLIKGERLMDELRDLIGDRRIEELPMAFTAVATDLDSRREVWIDEGPLFDAIRASIAIPTLFTPSHYKGRYLVDGGLLNPVPIAPTLRDGNDLTFAVSLAGHRDPRLDELPDEPATDSDFDKYRAAIQGFVEKVTQKISEGGPVDEPTELSLFEVLNRSFDVMQGAVSRLKLAAHHPDLLIEVPRNVCLTYEFYRASRIIKEGRRQAERALEDFGG